MSESKTFDINIKVTLEELATNVVRGYGSTLPLAHVLADNWVCFSDPSILQIQGNQGVTTAHVAARKGVLPEGFDQWHLANETGWTVAHEAAKMGLLPADFDQWALADHDG